jgi:hypothetical protein
LCRLGGSRRLFVALAGARAYYVPKVKDR